MLLEEPKPTLNEWKTLFDLFFEIDQQAPWQLVEADQLFAIRATDGGQETVVALSFAQADRLVALIGSESIQQFFMAEENEADLRSELERQIYRLSMTWTAHNLLEADEQKRFDGFKIRPVDQQLPSFRSHRPGFVPHPLTSREARLLVMLLTRLQAALPAIEAKVIKLPHFASRHLWIETWEAGAWYGSIESLQKLPYRPVEVIVDREVIEFLQKRAQTPMTVEVDCSVFDGLAVGDGDERPITPYGLMLVDPRSSSVLATEVLDPSDGLRELWAAVPNMILFKLAEQQLRPERMRMTSPLLHQIFEPYAAKLDIELELVDEMPALNHAKRAFMHYIADN
ncbi:MAG: hypothetical protein AAF633_19650 [Chloroflexota bacterium]